MAPNHLGMFVHSVIFSVDSSQHHSSFKVKLDDTNIVHAITLFLAQYTSILANDKEACQEEVALQLSVE